MGFVNALKGELSKTDVYTIGYTVTPNDPEYDTDYYNDISFNISLSSRW